MAEKKKRNGCAIVVDAHHIKSNDGQFMTSFVEIVKTNKLLERDIMFIVLRSSI